jgi:hypothetical protein
MKLRTALATCTVAVAVVAAPVAAAGTTGAEPAATTAVSLELVAIGTSSKPEVQGVATGDGAPQAACDRIAEAITFYIQDAIESVEEGDIGHALDQLDRADALDNAGQNEGCGFVYPV